MSMRMLLMMRMTLAKRQQPNASLESLSEAG